MTDKRAKNIVIVGGGTAGWMAAAACAKLLARDYHIRLVESDDIGTIGVGEATVPHLRLFNQILGIDEAAFVRSVKGTFKLGIEFADWLRPGHRYVHGFGTIGHEFGYVPFYQYWLKRFLAGQADHLGAYSLNTAAAPAGRFMTSATDVAPQSPLANIAYAYHFDAGLYAQLLRRYSEDLGVVRTEGRVVDVRLRAGNGHIDSIVLASGERIAGDLFIDCSGLRGLLIEGALHTGYDDWTHWLPCDRALAVPCEVVGPPTPFTRSTARRAGWQWRIPLQHRTGNGYVYSSAHISDDEATASLLGNLDGRALGDPRAIRYVTGMRRRAWSGNCLALGLAAGFLEPLESTSIYLIQSGIARFINLLPDLEFSTVVIDRYNAQARFEYERIRDFLILHYHATERADSPFWEHCRAMPIPESLAGTIELFRDSGRFFRNSDELFGETSWVQVMVGQGIVPGKYHPIVDQIPEGELVGLVDGARDVIARCVQAMPPHGLFIDRHCKA